MALYITWSTRIWVVNALRIWQVQVASGLLEDPIRHMSNMTRLVDRKAERRSSWVSDIFWYRFFARPGTALCLNDTSILDHSLILLLL